MTRYRNGPEQRLDFKIEYGSGRWLFQPLNDRARAFADAKLADRPRVGDDCYTVPGRDVGALLDELHNSGMIYI